MKKHFLLLALAAICSLGVMGETITVDWGHGKTNTLPENSSSGPIDGITLSSDIPFDGEYNSSIGYNDYYDFKGADVLSSRSVIIKAGENVTLTKINAVGRGTWGGGDLIFEFYSSAENLTSSSLLKSETMKIGDTTTSDTDAEYAAPSGEETKAIKIYRPSSYWNGRPLLLSVTITAKSTAAAGPVDPITKFDNGTYYIGSTGLDLSSLLTTKNKDGAVTYTVKDANGTGATITGSTFTATTAGTATVTASQEAVPDKYNDQSVDATITVATAPVHAYAKSVDFMRKAESKPSICNLLNDSNYTASPSCNDLYWDESNPYGHEDSGLGIDEPHSLSFWVKANQKVTIKVGTLNGHASTHTATLSRYNTYGTLIKDSTINQLTTTVCTTTQETQFVITTPVRGVSYSWNRIQQITIDPAPYHVYFNAGEGSGEMAAWEKATGETYNLPACTFTPPTNKSFAGWKLQGGTDEIYKVNAEFTMGGADVTFVAQWAQNLADPEITFDNATYKVGETTLDLSSLFHSKSSGAVTYTVKDAGTTDATISGTTFTALHTGTAVVTASQERVEGSYNAGFKDATITVIAFADSVDFEYFAGKYGSGTTGVAHVLDSCHYTVTNLNSGVEWDKNSAAGDNGLKFGDWVARELSFFVPANRSVVIKMGVMNQGSSGTTKLFIDGKETTPFVGATGDYSQGVENGPYITTKETKFEIKVTDPYWTLIQKITIKELKYTITFNPGEGGQGTMDADAEFAGKTYSLPECTFTHTDGKVFDGWKYSEDDQIYAENATITMPAKNISFTAQWKTPEVVPHSVTYSAGDGGAWTDSQPTEVDHTEGQTFTLPASSVVARTGYQFAGWNDGTQTYAAGSSYRMPNDNVTLTALWNKLYTVTYVAGCDDYTGTLPTQDPQIDGAKFTVAAAGIKRQGYAFKGWNDTYNTYQPDAEYTMPARDLVFTAQWEAVTVPTVTDLAITEPVNEIVPLSWNIPGLVDMSKATAPYDPGDNGDANPSLTVNDDGSVDVLCNLVQWGNSGVGFTIPATDNIDKVSFEYKITFGHYESWLWGGVGDGPARFNWQGQYNGGKLIGDKADWTPAQCTMNEKFWDGGKLSLSATQVGVFVNANANYNNQAFSVRNVRYHATGMSDVEIAKVTLVRKAGSASANPADGDVLIDQQVAFDFTDKDAKEAGTYYYTVFAYDAEGNVSAAVTTEYVLEVKQTYTVTYAKGGEDVIGEVPVDEMPKVEGTKFNLPAPGSLLKPYCQFLGWNDGEDTYQVGGEYTMPADNVTFTAQWQEYNRPTIPLDVTNLNQSNQTTSIGAYTLLDENCIDLSNGMATGQVVEWKHYIYPAKYQVTCRCGTISYGYKYGLYLIDLATGEEVMKQEGTRPSDSGTGEILNSDVYTWDLTNITPGRCYIIRVKNLWNDASSNIKVAYVDFQVQPTVNILLKDNDEDNNVQRLINAFVGVDANISLQRTLSSASLNTLCLPFSLSAEDLNAEELYAFTGAAVSQSGDGETLLTLQFEDADEIEAGVPYLIRPSEDVVNPTFNNVTITATEPQPVGDENVLFQGIYTPTELVAYNEDNLFVGANNTLYWPDEDATMPGLRAYFQILTPAAKVATRAQMEFNQHATTDLNIVRPVRAERYKYIDRNGRLIIVRDRKAYGVLGLHLAR